LIIYHLIIATLSSLIVKLSHVGAKLEW